MNYAFHLLPTLIIIAVALDASCGDPAWFPHPVRLIGWTIAAGDRYLHTYDRRRDLIRGGLLVIAVITATGLTTWAIITAGQMCSQYVGAAMAILVAWTTISARGLDDAARAVELHLRVGDEGRARYSIHTLVGRDPETLDASGLIRRQSNR